jgi:NAD(P)-dependent dehydrogenase (short-subunit alcohol dehydrogenase family)
VWIRLARLYFPQMIARNWGRIIFISSESGYQIPAEMIHYGMTKAAQIAVARGLAETTAGTADLTAAALCHTRGGGVLGDLRGKPAILGDQRRGAAGGRERHQDGVLNDGAVGHGEPLPYPA